MWRAHGFQPKRVIKGSDRFRSDFRVIFCAAFTFTRVEISLRADQRAVHRLCPSFFQGRAPCVFHDTLHTTRVFAWIRRFALFVWTSEPLVGRRRRARSVLMSVGTGKKRKSILTRNLMSRQFGCILAVNTLKTGGSAPMDGLGVRLAPFRKPSRPGQLCPDAPLHVRRRVLRGHGGREVLRVHGKREQGNQVVAIARDGATHRALVTRRALAVFWFAFALA
mmetsp:Transcript_11469/g.48076  ORF Transcript_11469/g.48076 Transcript_11469/m.48076 type:complete len:222 (-) Transcript_11469:296-961(-)